MPIHSNKEKNLIIITHLTENITTIKPSQFQIEFCDDLFIVFFFKEEAFINMSSFHVEAHQPFYLMH